MREQGEKFCTNGAAAFQDADSSVGISECVDDVRGFTSAGDGRAEICHGSRILSAWYTPRNLMVDSRSGRKSVRFPTVILPVGFQCFDYFLCCDIWSPHNPSFEINIVLLCGGRTDIT